MHTLTRLALIAAATALGAAASAQTAIHDAWVRGTVAQQKASGAFMHITSAGGGKLVSASSPVASVVEIHEMVMDGNVMKMRAVAGLELPAGKTVELKPGGYHVMLMDLKRPLREGESVPVTLTFEDRAGRKQIVEVSASVKALTAVPASDAAHKH